MSNAVLDRPLPPPVFPEAGLPIQADLQAPMAEKWAPPTGKPVSQELPKFLLEKNQAASRALRNAVTDIDSYPPPYRDTQPENVVAAPEQQSESRMHRLGKMIGRLLGRRTEIPQTEYSNNQPQQSGKVDMTPAIERIEKVAKKMQAINPPELLEKQRSAEIMNRIKNLSLKN